MLMCTQAKNKKGDQSIMKGDQIMSNKYIMFQMISRSIVNVDVEGAYMK